MLLRANFPRQVRSKEEEESLTEIGKQANIVITATFMIPFLAQFALKGVMSKLWLWINMMQLYTGLSFLKINMPENVLIV